MVFRASRRLSLLDAAQDKPNQKFHCLLFSWTARQLASRNGDASVYLPMVTWVLRHQFVIYQWTNVKLTFGSDIPFNRTENSTVMLEFSYIANCTNSVVILYFQIE